MSDLCYLRQENIYCTPKLMKVCTFMLGNILFKMVELDLTKNKL